MASTHALDVDTCDAYRLPLRLGSVLGLGLHHAQDPPHTLLGEREALPTTAFTNPAKDKARKAEGYTKARL
jgi:hypothetical protein